MRREPAQTATRIDFLLAAGASAPMRRAVVPMPVERLAPAAARPPVGVLASMRWTRPPRAQVEGRALLRRMEVQQSRVEALAPMRQRPEAPVQVSAPIRRAPEEMRASPAPA
jgi:hypothetical protein